VSNDKPRYVSAPLKYISSKSWWMASSFSSFSYKRQFNTHHTAKQQFGTRGLSGASAPLAAMSFCCLCFTVRLCFSNNVCSQTAGGPGTRGTDSRLHDTDSLKNFGPNLLLKVLMFNMHEIWSFDSQKIY